MRCGTALVEIGYTPTPQELNECLQAGFRAGRRIENVQARDLLAIARQVIPTRAWKQLPRRSRLPGKVCLLRAVY